MCVCERVLFILASGYLGVYAYNAIRLKIFSFSPPLEQPNIYIYIAVVKISTISNTFYPRHTNNGHLDGYYVTWPPHVQWAQPANNYLSVYT